MRWFLIEVNGEKKNSCCWHHKFELEALLVLFSCLPKRPQCAMWQVLLLNSRKGNKWEVHISQVNILQFYQKPKPLKTHNAYFTNKRILWYYYDLSRYFSHKISPNKNSGWSYCICLLRWWMHNVHAKRSQSQKSCLI